MASKALTKWHTVRHQELDELLHAHAKIGGGGPGRRYTTEQLNFAYLVAVAAQFQGFCRDLHSEAVGAFAAAAPTTLSTILYSTLTKNRSLDKGNANGGTIADDFGRLGMTSFWDLVAVDGGPVLTAKRRDRMEQMNMWRNAIAHNNFEQYQSKVDKLDNHLRPRLVEGRKCRTACDKLAVQMASAVGTFLHQVAGKPPW
jgi:hypothetical protein